VHDYKNFRKSFGFIFGVLEMIRIDTLFQIKAVSTQLDVLVAQIKSDRARRSHNKIDEPLAINIFDINAGYKANDKFIRSYLLIDCLLRMKENPSDMENFIHLCEKEYKDNKTELAVIHEFKENYNSARVLRWYTRQSFLFRMINKGLRVQNIDILFLFRFFIHDIQQQLLKNQCTQPTHLYRAQLLTNDELKMLKNAIGGFITVNAFFSTTIDRETSLAFLDSMDSSDEYNMMRVLFEIDADPRLEGTKPFANIIWLSYCFGQQEILMMVGSIFRIVEIQHEENQMCIIRLVLCSENDHDLKNAFEHLRKEYNTKEKMDLFSFGHILCDMGSFDDAKKFYLRFLDDLPSDHQDLATCYQALGNVAADKGDCDLSLEWYEKLHDLLTRTLKPDDSRLGDSHTIIGNIYWRKNDLKHALDSYNKALAIYKRTFDENHLTIAECMDKIGAVHEKEKKYFQALNHFEKSLAIRQKSLPPDHPNLGTAHSKVANIRLLLCHYYLALGHYNMALKIKLNSLPPEHLDIAADYLGMGHTYKSRGEVGQALSYYEKAAEIYRSQLPSVHPDVVEIERTIRFLTAQNK
jgi:tetratricopeptide (TPR) repeat protein